MKSRRLIRIPGSESRQPQALRGGRQGSHNGARQQARRNMPFAAAAIRPGCAGVLRRAVIRLLRGIASLSGRRDSTGAGMTRQRPARHPMQDAWNFQVLVSRVGFTCWFDAHGQNRSRPNGFQDLGQNLIDDVADSSQRLRNDTKPAGPGCREMNFMHVFQILVIQSDFRRTEFSVNRSQQRRAMPNRSQGLPSWGGRSLTVRPCPPMAVPR
jgi:hypothetical protein